jgi:Glycine zipper
MLTLKQVKSNAVLMMAMAVPVTGLAPMLTAAAIMGTPQTAQAQPVLFNRLRISAGAVLPIGTEKGEKILLNPTETKRFTLIIPQNLRASNGTLLVAAGSKVEGEFRPVDNGTQFIAQTLVTSDGKRFAMDGSSPVISRREKVNQGISTSAILKGAGAGAAAGAIIGGVTGDKKITLGKVLIGTAVGAAAGAAIGRNQVEMIAVYPNQDLSLRLNQALSLN